MSLMSQKNNNIHVHKFDSTKYDDWRIKMEGILDVYEL